MTNDHLEKILAHMLVGGSLARTAESAAQNEQYSYLLDNRMYSLPGES
jgi:hypothetical protein